jgi:GNAT superfamily N-acetyltransferase
MEGSNIQLIRFVETLAANAWRPAIEQHLDGWRLRVTGGSSSRVNSVWPNQVQGILDLAQRLEIVEAFYWRHGEPACFQLCPAALPVGLHSELQARGYQDGKLTAVKTAPVDLVLNSAQPPQTRLTHTDRLTDEWFQAYTSASGYDPGSLPIRRGILSRIGPQAVFMLLKQDAEVAATGLGVVERGWMGVFCVVTVPALRRQGLASQVMHGLADWGKATGADQLYLQVMEDNPPALAMYDRLGFKKLYEYWYSSKTQV